MWHICGFLGETRNLIKKHISKMKINREKYLWPKQQLNVIQALFMLVVTCSWLLEKETEHNKIIIKRMLFSLQEGGENL